MAGLAAARPRNRYVEVGTPPRKGRSSRAGPLAFRRRCASSMALIVPRVRLPNARLDPIRLARNEGDR